MSSTSIPAAGLPPWVSSTWVESRPWTGRRSSAGDEHVEPQCRDPADLRDRGRISVVTSFGSRRSKSLQDRILGVTADADDIGKAEFGTVGVVDALERLVFGIRQPVESERCSVRRSDSAVSPSARLVLSAKSGCDLISASRSSCGARSTAAFMAANSALTPANGRAAKACSAIHGEYSKILASAATKSPCCRRSDRQAASATLNPRLHPSAYGVLPWPPDEFPPTSKDMPNRPPRRTSGSGAGACC